MTTSHYIPCTPLHEVTGVGESVDEEEERIPETSAGVHADEVQVPVHTYVIDHWLSQQTAKQPLT